MGVQSTMARGQETVHDRATIHLLVLSSSRILASRLSNHGMMIAGHASGCAYGHAWQAELIERITKEEAAALMCHASS